MKLAIVHDWIVDIGGAERVLKRLHAIWPQAPIYTLLANPRTLREHFPNADIHKSGLDHIPGARRWYPLLAPLMPSAMESFDLSEYDMVLSSSVVFSKGVIVRPGTRHICYCYSPSRMLWDRSASYERSGILSRLTRHTLRVWDSQAAQRPDQMIAISQTVADRISRYYRRDAMVIPPPVELLTTTEQLATGDFFLIVGRLVPHKNLEMILHAFQKLRYPLVIAGSGPLASQLKAHASANVRFVGHVSDEQLSELYDTCRAVILPNEEDFGLTAVEAMAHGKPVLALRAGGATETIIEGVTGEFFDDAISEALADGVRRIRLGSYNPGDTRKQAARYSEEIFEHRMRILIESV